MRLKDFVERLENANATLDEIAEEIDGSQSATAAVRAIYVLGVVAGAYTQNYFLTGISTVLGIWNEYDRTERLRNRAQQLLST